MNDWLSFVNTRRLTDVTPPRIPVAHASLSTSLSASRSTGSLVRVGLSASTGSFRTVPVKGTLCDECLCRKCRCSTAPRRLPPLSQPLSQPATANHSLPQPTTAAAGGTEEVTLPTNTESGPVASERSAVASATAVVESELRSHRQKIISDMERFGGDNWWDNEMPTLPRSGKGVKSKLAKGRGGVFGAPFTDPESIWEALRAESGTATVLVRGSWLRKQEGLRRLPVRGSLPEEATIGVEELQAIWRASVRAERCTAIPVIAVSHAWKRADPGLTGQTYDPDPDGTTCAALIEALNARWHEFEAWGVRDVGLMIAWSSLHQLPRDLWQQIAYEVAVQSLSLWYAHAATTVWFVTRASGANKLLRHRSQQQSHEVEARALGFAEQGWPVLEWALSLLLTPLAADSAESGLRSWPLLVDLSRPTEAQATFRRPPPPEPLAFHEGHAFGSKFYAVDTDRDAVVAPIYAKSVVALLGSVESLSYVRQRWRDPELLAFLLVLPLCHRLQTLVLMGNELSDDGMIAASSLFEGRPNLVPMLTSLDLSDNRICAAGIAALAAILNPKREIKASPLGGGGSPKGSPAGSKLVAPVRAPLARLSLLNLSGNPPALPEAHLPLQYVLNKRRQLQGALPGLTYAPLQILDTTGVPLRPASPKTSPRKRRQAAEYS